MVTRIGYWFIGQIMIMIIGFWLIMLIMIGQVDL